MLLKFHGVWDILMCMGNREIAPSEHYKIVKYIAQLQNIGITHVTLNSPYLCELVKQQFPEIKVTIGLYAYIYSLQHIKYWIDLGADELTLHHRLNRNFSALENILTATKSDPVSLRVIANNVCLHDCPYQINHGCGQAHASQESDKKKSFYLDYNLLKCNRKKIESPASLIAAEWIRPEDVHYYSELCERTGNENFSIKLLERTKTTEFLERVVEAYLAERYDGNLIDILTWATSKNTMSVDIKSLLIKVVTGNYSIPELKKYQENFNLPKIIIDNRSLDGFLDHFSNNYNCDKMFCAASCVHALQNESMCSYCNSWADKAISYDEKERDKWLLNSKSVIDSMTTSKIFRK